VASDAHIKADNTEIIDMVLVSGCLNPGRPNDRLNNANIIIVNGRPKEIISPKPLCRQNSRPIISQVISLRIKADHMATSSHLIFTLLFILSCSE
jgi:hypothetical protein